MARHRMSDAEREAKRRARSAFTFSEASYKHYDPDTEGWGSAESWEAIADALADALCGHGVNYQTKAKTTVKNPDLEALGLLVMPDNVADLKRAFRNSMFVAHPDYGGTDAAARLVIEAYKRLLKHF